MKELYKVRNINISLLDKTTYEPLLVYHVNSVR